MLLFSDAIEKQDQTTWMNFVAHYRRETNSQGLQAVVQPEWLREAPQGANTASSSEDDLLQASEREDRIDGEKSDEAEELHADEPSEDRLGLQPSLDASPVSDIEEDAEADMEM